MPATGALPVASEDVPKRKRVDSDVEVSTPRRTIVEKPSNRSRKNSTISVAEGQPAKKSKQTRVKKLIPTSAASVEGADSPKKRKQKTIAFAENALTSSKETRKVNMPQRDPKLSAVSDEVGKDFYDAVARKVEEEGELHFDGFSSDSDSSDEDVDIRDAPPLDVSKLPTFSEDDAVVQRKLEKAKKHSTGDRGVLYLGCIPHGFYEDQIRAYFSQFGDVTRLRLSRNARTGKSKHYAFIEFTPSAVAKIVSETMDNYLLLGHILKCKVIPKDQVHPELWIGANKKWRMVPRDRIARLKQNKPRTDGERRHAESKLLHRQKTKNSRILALGIDYDFQEVAYKRSLKPAGVVSLT